jgi:pilus assembly protein FimV
MMPCLSKSNLLKVFYFLFISWSSAAGAINLGLPQLLSQPGEPLRVEIPIRFSQNEQTALSSLTVVLPGKSVYERLGIPQNILELNPQAMVYRNRQDQLMILVESVNSVPITDNPFLDVLVNLNWSSGSLTKTYTLLLGDAQKIVVKSGQSLSLVATILAPRLDGATLDQTMLALFKANPDAFASGSINKLIVGAELNKPSQALLRSINPVEATQFVAEANAEWRAERDANQLQGQSKSSNSKAKEITPKDRLKIGSSADSDEQERRYTEELVAQEKQLEFAKSRVAELENNIADLKRLLDKSKEKKAFENNFGLGGFGPAILAIGLIALTGLLLWGFARNARRSEPTNFIESDNHEEYASDKSTSTNFEVPERTKALFAGIDLDLAKPAVVSQVDPSAISNPLADTLRVKLNLARAYITIEDFSAAKKSLDEVLQASNSVDPTITVEAQGLLAELLHRNV